MNRRTFIQSTLFTGAAMAGTRIAGGPMALLEAWQPAPRRKFRLNYAPHFGMFRELAGEDLVAQLEFMAAEGFTALEDNGLRDRPVAEQERIGQALARLKMRMGVFVAHTIDWRSPSLTLPDPAKRDAFLKQVTESVEIAKRVNATWMTVVPGHIDGRLHIDFQMANVVETLKRAAAILEPHKLVMVLEPLNTLRNHPGMFLTTIPQAYLVCKAVGSPSCKILYDLYHQQITEGNLIPNIDAAWDEIAYFQVGDNPGRKEPGTGEINYRNVFKHIHGKGYMGIVGMEHGNAAKGHGGERAVIDAYIAAEGWS
jgi:hydroxypyruvate isomerase